MYRLSQLITGNCFKNYGADRRTGSGTYPDVGYFQQTKIIGSTPIGPSKQHGMMLYFLFVRPANKEERHYTAPRLMETAVI